jgi:enoyl-CoA hydratase/carnithine racemase
MSRAWQLETFGRVVRLTLTRPPINALDEDALGELEDVVVTLAGEGTARALIITGGRSRVFCSGGDLKYWRGIRDGAHVSERGRKALARVELLDIPTIAAINGSAIGDGIGLALACDLRVAAADASFRLPELGYGFIPGWGPIRALVAVVGRAAATELLLTGRPWDAPRALEAGLVHDVIPAEALQDAALERASDLSKMSRSALRAAKRVLRGEDERSHFQEVWGARDWEEGIEALLAKRTPDFEEA